jgi:hypothetical protein
MRSTSFGSTIIELIGRFSGTPLSDELKDFCQVLPLSRETITPDSAVPAQMFPVV